MKPDAINNLSELFHQSLLRGFSTETAPVQPWRFDHRYPGSRLDSDCVDGAVSFRSPFGQPLPRTPDLAFGELAQRFGLTCKLGGRICREQCLALVESVPDTVRDVCLMLEVECLDRGQ